MIDPEADGALWNAVPNPMLLIGADGHVRRANASAENFLGLSEKALGAQPITAHAGPDSSLSALLAQVRRNRGNMAEYDVELIWPEAPPRLVDIFAGPYPEDGEDVLLLIHPRSIAASMDRSLSHRNAARSITGLAAMLSHEIKNPLSGISGAAQLLEMSLSEDERELATLIREEAERIGGLLARVEEFGAISPIQLQPTNIHDVLDRACKSAKAGFASHIRFIEEYDPSLPPALGDGDQLIQVMMNLLKNAAEASPQVGGLITVRTSYRAGMKVMTPSGRTESLPLQVIISDNGPGVPEDLQRYIFEPFVSSKNTGSGLGLALVSKIIADHGGMISCDSQPGWTRFRILLPIASAMEDSEERASPGEDAA